ncbi:MAG: hypothetical protein M3Z96_11970 [Pseudomonadota bacterium]|nr:hypothetical protein [Pseudomonadota bacterium]
MDLLILLTGYPTVSLRFLGKLMAPMWIAFAAINREDTPTLDFALLSASMQNVWLIYRGIMCVSYVREGNFKIAFGVIACAPIQMVYNMPLVPHIIYGVYRGLRYTHNTFVISPKKIEYRTSMRRLIVTQRMALMLVGPAGVFHSDHRCARLRSLCSIVAAHFLGIDGDRYPARASDAMVAG